MNNNETEFSKSRYTHRDYKSIKEDLISAIPSLTQEWTSREDSDPGIVLIKLMSMLGDNLSYNIDKIALEMYLSTVTQRKNCARILSLLGYKMHWYSSAKLVLHITNKNENLAPITITANTSSFPDNVSSFVIGSKNYVVVNSSSTSPEIKIPYDKTEAVTLVEGTLREVTFGKNEIDSNFRYYFNDTAVDENHMWLRTSSKITGVLVDNLYLTTDDDQIYYEFNVDEYDRPYIQFVNYLYDFSSNENDVTYTLRYILSSGSEGNISPSADVEASLNVSPGTSSSTVYSHSGNNEEIESEPYNSPGHNPQTVDDAREDAAKYVFTYDTLVTASDFEKAVKRYSGVTGSKLVDNQIIINEDLNIKDILARDPEILNDGDSLKPYSAIMYTIFGDFVSSATENPSYFEDPNNCKYPDDTQCEFYPYKPSNYIIAQVDESINDLKVINVDLEYGTTKVYPFKVAGELHFISEVSPSDIQEIISQINSNLATEFYPSNKSYGEKPNFIDIVDIIQNTDTRIKYFDAESSLINYTTRDGGVTKFDSTSFCKYQGLVPNNEATGNVGFRVNGKFMKFPIKYIEPIDGQEPLTELPIPILGGEYEAVTGFSIESESIGTITCENLYQLNTLVYYIKNGNISYAER